eukprot:1591285-Rhodomonas_salina.1
MAFWYDFRRLKHKTLETYWKCYQDIEWHIPKSTEPEFLLWYSVLPVPRVSGYPISTARSSLPPGIVVVLVVVSPSSEALMQDVPEPGWPFNGL